MATLITTPIKTFVSGETVTPAKLNELSQSTVALTAGTIVDADVSPSAAIALSKLATGALPAAITVSSSNTQSLVPAGAVMPFAMNSAPAGWLAADGAAVSRSTYATLFAAISTTHGVGDGSTTFNLPDLRGIFVRGSDSQTISGTAYSGTFAAKQQDAIQQHTHSSSATSSVSQQLLAAGGNGAATSGSVTGGMATGRSSGTETRPANIALLYCIKF